MSPPHFLSPHIFSETPPPPSPLPLLFVFFSSLIFGFPFSPLLSQKSNALAQEALPAWDGYPRTGAAVDE